MKIILYCRASTEDQSITMAAQQQKLEQFAALHDFEVAGVILDAGQSGKSLNRPGLQNALEMLRKGDADGLAVLKLDRLSRSIADFQTLIDGFFGERAGKQLFSVQDSIDTTSAAGRLVLNVLLSVAQWEREAIGERTKTALQHKISKRERVGAVIFGFDLAEDGISLVPNAGEQATIARMHELRAAGNTLRGIANALTARQIATKSGKGVWSHTAVSYILGQDRAVA
jgi:site-specific DNA recombinase